MPYWGLLFAQDAKGEEVEGRGGGAANGEERIPP